MNLKFKEIIEYPTFILSSQDLPLIQEDLKSKIKEEMYELFESLPRRFGQKEKRVEPYPYVKRK